MPSVLIEYPVEKKTRKPPLVWYDPEKKKMLSFEAERLSFERKYDEDLKKFRMLPVAVKVKKEEKTDIKDWHKKYIRQHGVEIDLIGEQRKGIEFYVPEEEVDEFVRSARRDKLRTRVL